MLENGVAKIEKSMTRLTILIPSKKNWFFLIFATAWMGGWCMGFTMAFKTLFAGTGNSGADTFLAFWLIAWTVGGLTVITLLLWGYFGKETFILESGKVLFQKTIFGIGQKKALLPEEINNIRTETGNNRGFGGNRITTWGLGPGKIKFDYGFKTYSFGLGVDDAEALHIVQLLKEYFKK